MTEKLDLKNIRGVVVKFGDHINTDNIMPSQHLNNPDPNYYSQFIMTGIDPNFPLKVREIKEKHDLPVIIVAGENWASGSSREQAAEGLKRGGIAAIVADSFGTIFFRNACNVGLPVVILPQITQKIEERAIIKINMLEGQITIENQSQDILTFKPLEEFLLTRIQHGGLLPELRELYGS